MFNFIILVGVVSIIGGLLALFFGFCEWAHENHRVPFFVKWYLDWNRRKGEYTVTRVKMEARVKARMKRAA